MSKIKLAGIILAMLSAVLAAAKAVINFIKCINELTPQPAPS